MPRLANIGCLATCANPSGQDDIGLIQDAALVWRDGIVRWAGPAGALPAEYEAELTAGRENLALTAVCGSVESELVDLDEDDRQEYLESYGLANSGIERLVAATYALLGLMSFLTAGESECRAWTIRRGASAVLAAGTVHTDFAKRFIRAETIQWDKLVSHGGYAKAKQTGERRLEGKDYVVQDGDVLVFRHG